jgi:hypothetical protein
MSERDQLRRSCCVLSGALLERIPRSCAYRRFQPKKYDTFRSKRASKHPTRSWSLSPNFSLSVFEKLSRYGALSDVEHVGLLVGEEPLGARLLKHSGSLKALTKASAVELGAFITTHDSRTPRCCFSCIGRVQTQDAYQAPSIAGSRLFDPG